MHWSEWAAIALGIVCAVPVLLLVFYLAAIAWVVIAGLWAKPQPVETTETPFGTFTKDYDGWSGETLAGDGKELTLYATDVNGAPNPDWLQKLPALLQELPRWEQIARQNVAHLTDDYELSSVSDGTAEDADFLLGFDYDEEAWGETVFVHFYQGQVVGWSAAD